METGKGAEFNIRMLVGAEKRKHMLRKITDREKVKGK